MDIRNAKGEQVQPQVGKWYVGVELRDADESGYELPTYGMLVQYGEDGRFYDEADEYGEEKEVRVGGYDYLVEQA